MNILVRKIFSMRWKTFYGTCKEKLYRKFSLDLKGFGRHQKTNRERKVCLHCWTNICIYFVTTMRESEMKEKEKKILTHCYDDVVKMRQASIFERKFIIKLNFFWVRQIAWWKLAWKLLKRVSENFCYD